MRLLPPPEWLYTHEQIDEAMRYFQTRPAVGVDCETTGTSIRDLPITVQFADEYRRVAMLAEHATQRESVRDLLLDPDISKVGTYVKRDLHWLANIGLLSEGPIEDTLVLDALYDENREGMHGLKQTAADYLGLRMMEFNEVFPKKIPGVKVKDVTTEKRIRYALSSEELFPVALDYMTKDSYASMLVRNHLREILSKDEVSLGYCLLELFDRVEKPFTRVLWNMERRGFMVHAGNLKSKSILAKKKLEEIEQKAFERIGKTLNLSSPQQLAEVLFKDLGHEVVSTTPGGAPSTGEETLTVLAGKGCEFSKLLLEHRSVVKTDGTYLRGLLEHVDSDLRIHTTLNQHITVTFRLSSREPNLQNLPRPDADEFKIREAFVASPGYILLVADYDQVELKIMASLAGEESMLEAIREGRDLHAQTASIISGIPYEEFVKAKKKAKEEMTERDHQLIELRSKTKAVNFGILYGMGAFRLADQLKTTPKEAQDFIDQYFGKLPKVKQFIEATHALCRSQGYVTSLLGHKRRLPGINLPPNSRENKKLIGEAQRQDVNVRIQGGSGSVTKMAMLRAEYDPTLLSLGVRMLMQVHDELVFECPDVPEVVERAKKRVKEVMEMPPFEGAYSVPLTVSCEAGYSWADAK